jgi:hypothetical protein
MPTHRKISKPLPSSGLGEALKNRQWGLSMHNATGAPKPDCILRMGRVSSAKQNQSRSSRKIVSGNGVL